MLKIKSLHHKFEVIRKLDSMEIKIRKDRHIAITKKHAVKQACFFVIVKNNQKKSPETIPGLLEKSRRRPTLPLAQYHRR